MDSIGSGGENLYLRSPSPSPSRLGVGANRERSRTPSPAPSGNTTGQSRVCDDGDAAVEQPVGFGHGSLGNAAGLGPVGGFGHGSLGNAAGLGVDAGTSAQRAMQGWLPPLQRPAQPAAAPPLPVPVLPMRRQVPMLQMPAAQPAQPAQPAGSASSGDVVRGLQRIQQAIEAAGAPGALFRQRGAQLPAASGNSSDESAVTSRLPRLNLPR